MKRKNEESKNESNSKSGLRNMTVQTPFTAQREIQIKTQTQRSSLPKLAS